MYGAAVGVGVGLAAATKLKWPDASSGVMSVFRKCAEYLSPQPLKTHGSRPRVELRVANVPMVQVILNHARIAPLVC
jgi:hypothetical protein